MSPPSETPTPDRPADARAATAQSLEELHASMVEIRGIFMEQEETARWLIACLQDDQPMTPRVTSFGVPSDRDRLTVALERYELARRAARVSMWRVLQAEGLSIGEISRTYGLSRQLVSRMLRDDATPDPSPAG